MNGNLKLAIQKKGRLTEKSLALLRMCGVDVENYKDRLFVTARNFSLDVLFLRDDDIPEYVQDGVADIGIVGQNVVFETGADVNEVEQLGFGKCELMFGIRESENLKNLSELNGKTIATSYPKILGAFLNENNIIAKIIQISGSVEIAPILGIADVICDLVSTGTTLKMNKLKKSFSVYKSQSVLISNKKLEEDAEKLNLLNDLVGRIRSALTAEKSRYVMMNVPKSNLNSIISVIPSVNSPTVLPLADSEMFAVHAVVPKNTYWEMVSDLKAKGASGILSLPIESMIL